MQLVRQLTMPIFDGWFGCYIEHHLCHVLIVKESVAHSTNGTVLITQSLNQVTLKDLANGTSSLSVQVTRVIKSESSGEHNISTSYLKMSSFFLRIFHFYYLRSSCYFCMISSIHLGMIYSGWFLCWFSLLCLWLRFYRAKELSFLF